MALMFSYTPLMFIKSFINLVILFKTIKMKSIEFIILLILSQTKIKQAIKINYKPYY